MKRLRKIAETPEEKECLIALYDLPSWCIPLTKWVQLFRIAERMGNALSSPATGTGYFPEGEVKVGVPKLDQFLTQSDAPQALISHKAMQYAHSREDSAQKALNQLAAAALKGNPYAARALRRVVEEAVVVLNGVARKRLDLFRPVAEKATGWPIIHSEMPDERERNKALINDLNVGSAAPLRAVKTLSKCLRWSESNGVNGLTMRYCACLQILASVAALVAQDQCNETEFAVRCDILLKKWSENNAVPGVRTMLLELHDGKDPCHEASLSSMIWSWLHTETGGYPERIRELRKKALNRDVAKRDVNNRLAMKLASQGKPKTSRTILDYLKHHVWPGSMEVEIQTQMRKLLRSSMNWLKLPAKADE